MRAKRQILRLLAIWIVLLSGCADSNRGQQQAVRMQVPKVVTPPERCGEAPSNAIILFDGKDLSQWVSVKDGGSANWPVSDGYMEVGDGNIRTKQSFGNCQLHIEWATPSKINPDDKGQGRGNSGVLLMGKYEVQILDSYGNSTYPDGQAASVYCQSVPLVNASRRPGEWQSYDMIFHRPTFSKSGRLIEPATITLLHNGVLVQDNFEIKGTTLLKRHAKYEAHSDRLPIVLQDHGDAVRFRNIWIAELP